MLYEISCSKFHQKRIQCKNGLNTVLGTNSGSNSIGKSTFLMIIDFVFGGKTYSKATDIIKNVGEHEIQFSFLFNKEQYWFSRNILTPGVVWKCDKMYNKIKSISLTDYCGWLNWEYQINLPGLSFRDCVGRYIRVYGKENINEKLPLHAATKETASSATYAILKLFDLYRPIAESVEKYSIAKESYQTYVKAQKQNFIPNITTKKAVIVNEKEITKTDDEIEGLLVGINRDLLNFNPSSSDEVIELKQQLNRAKRKKAKLRMMLKSIEENLNYPLPPETNEFQELQRFFPQANISSISEIEEFHKNLATILQSEFQEERSEIIDQISDCNTVISTYIDQLGELISNPRISDKVLQKYSELQHRKEKLQQENNSYSKRRELLNSREDAYKRIETLKTEQCAILSTKICKKMQEINQYIYGEQSNAPIISFQENNYTFFTPDDTGTGIAYKGLIVFDLAVLLLTKLPVLAHDSILLKHIADQAIEKILELYSSAGKQVFIALDKQNSYTKKSQEILSNSCILSLGTDGNELFGRSWG